MFKIGLLGSVEIIAAIAEVVSDYPEVPLVLDPVLSSGRGDELATEDMVIAMRELLIPQTTLSRPTVWRRAGLPLDDGDDSDDPALEECARRILASGCEYVLITGTHENTPQVVNILYSQDGVVRSDSWQRLPGTYHGSGCTLASAIAATIANGLRYCRGGARRSGIHLADAELGLPPRHGPADSRSPVLGARRRREDGGD